MINRKSYVIPSRAFLPNEIIRAKYSKPHFLKNAYASHLLATSVPFYFIAGNLILTSTKHIIFFALSY